MTRPTKPTVIKQMAGTLRKDRVKNEPRPPAFIEMPAAPEYFDEHAIEEWYRLGPVLKTLGLLTVADRSLFIAYCLSYSRLASAAESLQAAGELFHEYTNKVGATNFVARPEIAVIQKETLLLKAICAEFGLSPSARGRMEVPIQD
ncbi:phage terminase small subunit P27 family [Paenibacillus harenae]|uniref:P27 family predicted phage terminase small subunit n=1 Tax=Paenibacillus harenae TaxID=306543 RepID=A0ABT9U5M7_PAEHA|nr:phage terminase small subunit P27 family [Paenibacillus harenae]MDQ0114371.1 P27 family predicted phage terminase small subunit [Paenibacillus harenae]